MRRSSTVPPWIFWLALGIATISGIVVARAEGAAPPHELTLDEALEKARKANWSLVAERTRLVQAKASVDKAWTVLFPTVAAQGKYQRNNIAFSFPQTNPVTQAMSTLTLQPIDQLDAVFSFSQPLVVPAAYPGLKAVDKTEEATRENVHANEVAVLFDVAQTFYAAVVADEVVVARQSSIEVARATLENSDARFSAGAVTKVDVDRAAVALLRAEQGGREATFAREQTYRALATLIRLEQPFKVRVASGTPGSASAAQEHMAPASGTDLASALRLRPEFRQLEATAEAQEAEQRSHAWRWAPSLSGFGNARLFNYDNFAKQSHSWAIGAQLDWLIYDAGVRDTNRRLSAAQAAETTARAEVLRENIRDDLADGRRRVETKMQAQQTFERAVELARETLDLVRIQYEAGQVTQIDLLVAQANLVDAELALANAHFDLAVADLSLRRAAGTFPDR